LPSTGDCKGSAAHIPFISEILKVQMEELLRPTFLVKNGRVLVKPPNGKKTLPTPKSNNFYIHPTTTQKYKGLFG
jgi:hypothetical protein